MSNVQQTNPSTQPHLETATLGGGCFWCLEPLFASLQGVEDASVGYAGGSVANPSYHLVTTGTSGHAEVVQVLFDPQVISYRDILGVFFSVHDPTTLNRQGADVGPQYRSVIFYHNSEQKHIAEQVIQALQDSGAYSSPIVTEIAPLEDFFLAEDYHQEYFEKNPYQGYCQVVIAPKVSKFRAKYQPRLKI